MVGLLDLLFPPSCVHCGRGGHWLCPQCIAAIVPAAPALRVPESLAGLWMAGDYEDPLRLAIQQLKYQGKRRLAEPLGRVLAETFRRQAQVQSLPDAVLPVPLHPQRQAERGYNQSALLARVFCRLEGLQLVEDALRRSRDTPQQARMTRAQRQANVSGAFTCPKDHPMLVGRRVLLIDDVCTTGSTLSACAEKLLAAGAREVWGLVLARPAL
ncbi:MAG TPA: ComF family protein [Ktedonobacterales bacterium]|jgi:ComF family protein